MRAVLQRVTHCRVAVAGRVVGEIGPGILALVGVAEGDTDSDAAWLAQKIAELRIFRDDHRPMNRSVEDASGAVLVVSQFTLLADTRRGRRPGFTGAARPEIAEPLCRRVAGLLRERGLPVSEGEFGAMMEVELTNDGPVTIVLDSRAP
jgi:D-tyrosyl-tRNA(Tyr) deacylase